MLRLVGPVLVVLLTALLGCNCRGKAPAGSVDSAAGTLAEPTPTHGGSSEAVFSAPIAATMVGHARVLAGLVVADKVIRVRGLQNGQVSWTADVLRGVAWAPDAELRLLPAGDGVALVWRGASAKGEGGGSGSARTLVVMGPHGELRGEPVEVGATVCTTADGVAWLDPQRAGSQRVRARRWSETEVRDVAAIAPDRDPALVCGDHGVFVLGDGDDDLTTAAFSPGDPSPQPTRVAMRDSDFRDDEEREHETYMLGDDLGLVRVAGSGAIALREVPRAGAPSPWRTLKHALSADDDLVAVDGDATATILVLSHDADEACPGVGSSAEAIRALRVDRASGAETMFDLAAPDCDASRGPFWVAAAPVAPVVAWIERGTKLPATSAAIHRLAVRVIRPDGVRPTGVDVAADALVDGGCDRSGCFAAALLRPSDGDGAAGGPIVALGYP